MIEFARKSFLRSLGFDSTKTTTSTITTLEEVDEETTKIMTSTNSSTTATTEDHHHHTPNIHGKQTIHITTHEVVSLTMHHGTREPERPSKDEGSDAQNKSIPV